MADVTITFAAKDENVRRLIDELTDKLRQMNQTVSVTTGAAGGGSAAGGGGGVTGLAAALALMPKSIGATIGGIAKMGAGLAAAYIVVTKITRAFDRMADGMRAIAHSGLEFNRFLEDSQIGIAAILATQQEITDEQGRTLEGAEKFGVAMAFAADQVQKARIQGALTALTTREIVQGVQQTLGPLSALGLNLDQIRDYSVKALIAMRAMGVQSRELNQETRAIIAGTQTRNDRLNQILQISREEIVEAQRLGKVYELLNSRLKDFALAGEAIQASFSGTQENLNEALETFAGEITGSLFEKIKEMRRAVILTLFDFDTAQINPKIAGLAEGLRKFFDVVGTIGIKAINAILKVVVELSEWMERNRFAVAAYLDLWVAILVPLGSIVIDVLRLLGFTAGLAVQSGVIHATMILIASAVALIATALKIVLAVVKTVGAFIVKLILFPLQAILKISGAVGRALGLSWGSELQRQAAQLEEFGASLDDLAATSWSEIDDPIRGLIERIKTMGQESTKTKEELIDLSDFTLTPKPFPGDDDEGDKDKLKKIRDEYENYLKDRLQLQKKFLELSGRQVEADLLEAEEELREFLIKASRFGDKVGIQLAADVFKLQVLRARSNEAERIITEAQERMRNRIQEVEVQQQAGLLSATQAQLEIRQIYRETADALQDQITVLKEFQAVFENTIIGDKMASRIRELETELLRLRTVADKVQNPFEGIGDEFAGAFTDDITNAFDALIDGTKSVSQAFSDMARDIIRSIARVIQQMLVAYAVQQLLRAVGFTVGIPPVGRSGGLVTAASGGYIDARAGGRMHGAGSGEVDSILALLAPREYVIRARAVEHYGPELFRQLNQMSLAPRSVRTSMGRYAEGGLVQAPVAPRSQEASPSTMEGVLSLAPELVLQELQTRGVRKWFIRELKSNRNVVRGLVNR